MLIQFAQASRNALLTALSQTWSEPLKRLIDDLPAIDELLVERLTGRRIPASEYDSAFFELPSEQQLCLSVAHYLISQWLSLVNDRHFVSYHEVEQYIEELESPLVNLQAAVDWFYTISKV